MGPSPSHTPRRVILPRSPGSYASQPQGGIFCCLVAAHLFALCTGRPTPSRWGSQGCEDLGAWFRSVVVVEFLNLCSRGGSCERMAFNAQHFFDRSLGGCSRMSNSKEYFFQSLYFLHVDFFVPTNCPIFYRPAHGVFKGSVFGACQPRHLPFPRKKVILAAYGFILKFSDFSTSGLDNGRQLRCLYAAANLTIKHSLMKMRCANPLIKLMSMYCNGHGFFSTQQFLLNHEMGLNVPDSITSTKAIIFLEESTGGGGGGM